MSTFDQNPDGQLDTGQVSKTFIDKASGKGVKRPQFEALMSFVRAGDTLVVHSMDRLAHNLDDLRCIIQTLTQLSRETLYQYLRGVDIPRCTVLSSSEWGLFTLSNNQKDLIQQYTFSEPALSIMLQPSGAANRIGFAMQPCYIRYPGIILSINDKPFPLLLNLVADQLKMSANVCDEYGKRDQTRRKYLAELQMVNQSMKAYLNIYLHLVRNT